MKKHLISLLLLACIAIPSFAQFKILATSEGFDEPHYGYAKVIQGQNGYTYYLHASIRRGLDVRIYDENHQQIVEKNLRPNYGMLKAEGEHGIRAAFFMNNNIALFISEEDGNIPTLYRLIIDGKSGDLLEEKTIATLAGKRFIDNYSNTSIPKFYVKKDPESDNYAVILLNAYITDKNERIEIIHYDADHKELSRGFYQAADYKYITFMDACVRGNKEVFVLALGSNKDLDAEGSLLIGSLISGTQLITAKKLDIGSAGLVNEAMIKYNKATDNYIVVSARFPQRYVAKVYRTIISSTGEPRSTDVIDPSSINQASKKKEAFFAAPQLLNINDDGSYAIIFEENKTNPNIYTSSGNPGVAGMHQMGKTSLDDIGIIEYDAEGAEKHAFYIRKSQMHLATPRRMFSFLGETAGTELLVGEQYKSFYYIYGNSKQYIIINDIDKNQQRLDDGKDPVTIDGLGDSKAFIFELNAKNNVPRRQSLFSGTENDDWKNMVLFAASDFDREKNIWVTLELDRSHGKEMRLVWFQPE